jgi:hypothetical protein
MTPAAGSALLEVLVALVLIAVAAARAGRRHDGERAPRGGPARRHGHGARRRASRRCAPGRIRRRRRRRPRRRCVRAAVDRGRRAGRPAALDVGVVWPGHQVGLATAVAP